MTSLFQKYQAIKDKKNLPVADISHHRKTKPIPVADISHHRKLSDKRNVSEAIYGRNEDKESLTHNNDALEKEHAANLEDKHIDAARLYVSGGLNDPDSNTTGSRRVNKHLIDAHNSGHKPDDKFEFSSGDEERDAAGYTDTLHLKHLDEAISRNKLKKKLTTYSGVGFDPEEISGDDYKLHLPAYTSSSLSKEVAHGYTDRHSPIKHIIKITHPVGSSGLHIGNNEFISPFGQYEHLSPRGMTIQLHPEPEVHGNVRVWNAKRLTK